MTAGGKREKRGRNAPRAQLADKRESKVQVGPVRARTPGMPGHEQMRRMEDVESVGAIQRKRVRPLSLSDPKGSSLTISVRSGLSESD